MRSMLPEEVKDLLAGCSDYVMNFIYLVELIVTWKQRAQRQYLVHDTADSPDVHFVAVVAVG